MKSYKFKDWLLQEGKDIFGFEKDRAVKKKDERDEKPVNGINLEQISDYLSMHEIGVKRPRIRFVNEVHWGKGPGALRVWFGTGLNVMIERQGVDLNGTPRWYTKKIYQLDQTGYGGFEDAIAYEIIEQLEKIDETELDSAKRDYDDLESLVAHMASAMKRTARPVFIFEGIRKVDRNNYVIRFSLRGHGVEAQEQQRVEENQTQITFDKESGVVRVTNFNIESPVGKDHKWEIMPTDTDLNFFPTQSREEIVETMATTLHWY